MDVLIVQVTIYIPDRKAPVYYRDLLSDTEETGEEWEAYKRMLSGDFSLVEDERWGSLQSHYESNTEGGNEPYSWSYFLMDFNQDGIKELVVRLYRDGVNNTARFRYEDGKITMWGNYNSADSHGYELPLRNGKRMRTTI